MSRNCRCVGRVTISGRVVVGIGMSCIAGVVGIGMGVDGCIAVRGGIMMSASDHGRTCGPTHMNLVSTPFISAVSVVSISMTVVAISITVVAVTVVGCISVVSSIAPICTTISRSTVASISSVSSIAAITAIAHTVAIITVSVPVV